MIKYFCDYCSQEMKYNYGFAKISSSGCCEDVDEHGDTRWLCSKICLIRCFEDSVKIALSSPLKRLFVVKII